MKNILYWMLCGTRGGATRTRILELIKDNPENANKIAGMLKLDYKTVRHHLDMLLKHRLIINTGDGYGAVYSLSEELQANIHVFYEICNKVKKVGRGIVYNTQKTNEMEMR